MRYNKRMKLIIGLGNPDQQYDGTRHNVGFWCIDTFADQQGAAWKQSTKFRAQVAELSLDGEKVLLAKPTTYYNLVGESAHLLADFYKIAPEDILVIHDDFAIPLGTIRTRIGGSDAGNNGVKSINLHLDPAVRRLRVGIYTEHRDCMDDVDFVLGRFTADEQKLLTDLSPKISSIITSFVHGAFEPTTLS